MTGVLGNLTELEVLDMSFNGLTDLADEENPFNLPINLTHLYLQNNKIEKIDYEKITNLTNIKEINLENNRLERLNKTMVDLIRAGVLIHFKGEANARISEVKWSNFFKRLFKLIFFRKSAGL